MLKLINISYDVEEANGGKKRKKTILKNINLTLDENKMICITGPNGSGKSTLAKIIMGIVKPTSGQIIFNNKDITNLNITERAKLGISFAFQQPVKFKGITVKDLITLAAGEELDTIKACNYLSMVGLCARDYIGRDIDGKLSGGELKRIEIASVMARGGVLNIFDEPEAGIDLWSFNSLIDVFKTLNKKTKATNLIISHQERILEISDSVILLSGGEIKMVGTPDKVMGVVRPKKIACTKLGG